MRATGFPTICSLTFLIISILMTSCDQKANEQHVESEQVDLPSLEKEIALRLRAFETHLKHGDSIALGNMYLDDAVIMPSTVGKEKIIRNFGSMIRDSITGSSFQTTGLWGDNQLLVEEGTGIWSHENGEVVGRGTYLVVWKNVDGTWKILRDSWYPQKKTSPE